MQLSRFLLKNKLAVMGSARQLKDFSMLPLNPAGTSMRFMSTKKTQEKPQKEETASKKEKEQQPSKEEKEKKAKEEETESSDEQSAKPEEKIEDETTAKFKALEADLKKKDDKIKDINKQLEETNALLKESINKYKYQLAENDNTVKRYKDEIKKTEEY
mmetsp:Transcript_19571/g.22772  ORF Transcript_19571/g.22772 Transcript_19571/m.22772 type:complete len:159 (+) Transcript_19571:32-508(+)